MRLPVTSTRVAVSRRLGVYSLLLAGLALASLSCEGSTRPRRAYLLSLDVPHTKRDTRWVPVMQELLDMPAPAADWRPFAPYQLAPPPDDAPEEVLMAWWASASLPEPHDRPSAVATRRVLDALDRYPELLADLAYRLPDTPEVYRRVDEVLARERARSDTPLSSREQDRVTRLQAYRAPHSLDELREAVRTARHSESSAEVTAEDKIDELLERSPADARRLLDGLAVRSDVKVAAWAMSRRLAVAVADKDERRERELRSKLQAIAVDTTMPPVARDDAIHALAAYDWPSRDDWIMSLFLDPTLADLQDGMFLMSPLQNAVAGNPGSLVPRVIALIGHPQDHVHGMAVLTLAGLLDTPNPPPEALRALLPWLDDLGWIRLKRPFIDAYRQDYISALARVSVPEAVPGLIHVARTDSLWQRVRAAVVLAIAYPVPDTAPVLREALGGALLHRHRMAIAAGLVMAEVLPVDEVLNGLGTYALLRSTKQGRSVIDGLVRTVNYLPPGGPSVSSLYIGMLAANEFSRLPGGLATEVATEMFTTADGVESNGKTAMAMELRRIAAGWRHPEIRSQILADMARGKVYSAVIRDTLAERAWYAETAGDELRDIIDVGGHAAGLAAIMLGNVKMIDWIVSGRDEDAVIAALAAARLIRQPIAVTTVAPLLTSTNKLLAMAAERYLQALDSPAVRTAVHEHHPGQLLVLGARERFAPVPVTADIFEVKERALVERIGEDDTLQELYALLRFNEDSGSGVEALIEIRSGGARLLRGSTERALTREELRQWSAFLAAQRVLDLPPLLPEPRKVNSDPLDFSLTLPPSHLPTQYEFLHLTRKRGRRIFMAEEPGRKDWASPYHLLWLHLQRLR